MPTAPGSRGVSVSRTIRPNVAICGSLEMRKLGNTLSVARFPYGILECAGISVIRMGKRRDADEGGNETHPNVP